MNLRTVGAVLFAACLTPAALPAADFMREGQWELTTVMEMPGMPVRMAPTTVKHCFTRDDVKDQKKAITRDKNCTVTEMKSTGNRVAWKMKCTGQNAGTFSGETVFSGDSYDSVMKMQAEAAKGQTMTMKVKGRRIGSCP